jgi:hypothetical protein
MVTGHLHQAMADFGTKEGTKTGTAGTVSISIKAINDGASV